MRGKNHRPVIVLLSTVFFVAGCSSSSASLAPFPPTSRAAASTEALVSTVTPTVTSSPTAIATARPTATPASSPTPGKTLADTAVVTVVDGVRVRSKPRVSDDSFKYEPLLPLGTPLYVLDGPVSASGYTWYEVVPLTSRTLHSGWVATASRSGDPWLAARDFACPPVPTDLRSLRALPSGVGLACFPRLPITVQARLIECNCEMDGPTYSPGWFGLGSGYKLLVEPEVTHPPADPGRWFILELDPAGQHPDVLPVSEVVEVTGFFDHPAAASCTFDPDGEPVPTQDCRLQFAVTRLVTVRP
jgi:hypothetical protein